MRNIWRSLVQLIVEMVVKYTLDADAAVRTQVGVGSVLDTLEKCYQNAKILDNTGVAYMTVLWMNTVETRE